MKTLYLILISILLSCEKPSSFKVNYYGALKNMMRKGDLSAYASLADFKNKKHLYALGAVENLKGEVQIFNGKPFITSVENNELKFDSNFEKKASLLVVSSVESWKEFKIPTSIKTKPELEVYIEKIAKENGMNTEEPFPFLIDGVVDSFDWHVINWKDGDTNHSHQKHKTSSFLKTCLQ
jgi:acetolactate decarboxylase